MSAEYASFCLVEEQGTVTRTITINCPYDIGQISEYHWSTFDQTVIYNHGTQAQIQTVSKTRLFTTAPYPIDWSTMPTWAIQDIQPETSARGYYGPHIQSDNPEIVALATSLVQDATTQAEAVEAIQAWVRANIEYDYTFSSSQDALTVLHRRSGTCSGFSTLTVALLRAANIPSRWYAGCVTWTSIHGEKHAWILVNYPDTGWVAAEPQNSANMIGTNYIMGDLWVCGRDDALLTEGEQRGILAEGLSIETPWPSVDAGWGALWAASLTAIDRKMIDVTPDEVLEVVWAGDPHAQQNIWLDNNACEANGWHSEESISWLSVSPESRDYDGDTTITLNGGSLAPGKHEAQVTFVQDLPWWEDTVPDQQIVPVTFWITSLRTSYGTPWIDNYAVSGGSWANQNTFPRVLGDVDGDGDEDIVGFGNRGVYVSLAQDDEFTDPRVWRWAYGPASGGWTDQDTFPRMLGDVNGDGKEDIVAFGNRAVYVSLSYGSYFGAPTAWILLYGPAAGGWFSQDTFPRMVGDVNGDGRDDIVAFGNRATYVSLSTGTSFGGPIPWIYAYGPAAGGWNSQNVFPRMLGDVNGDDKEDIVAFGNRATYVSLSTGRSFMAPAVWLWAYGPAAGGWSTYEMYPRVVGDVNGDGKDDIVAFGNNMTYLSPSTGTGFAGISEWIAGYGPAAGGWSGANLYPRALGDVNKDGKDDIVGHGHNVTFVSLSNR